MYKLKHLLPDGFLSEFWQKKPLVIRQAFDGFQDPLDEHELAGLAMEPELDSRIISRHQQNWQVHQGPFEDFEPLCIGSWSLLVQGVDRVLPDATELVKAFDFLPRWRIDDLMVSFSVAGAGVGPHLDQYDVFIVQGKGSRRWKVGPIGDYRSVAPHPKLSQIEGFEAIIDEVLQPGDVIYIPPGFPHDGQALEPCLNYSVGFRAPTQTELLSDFADFALEHPVFSKRYSDPNLISRPLNGEIKQQEVREFRSLLQEMIESEHFETWLPTFLTQDTSQTSESLGEGQEYTVVDIQNLLNTGTRFFPEPGLQFAFIEPSNPSQTVVEVCIQGEGFDVPRNEVANVNLLLNASIWPSETKNNYENSLFFNQFLTTLVNSGYWYPEGD